MNREVKIKNMKLAALNNAVYIFGILIIAVFSVMSPYFFTVTNATSILRKNNYLQLLPGSAAYTAAHLTRSSFQVLSFGA